MAGAQEMTSGSQKVPALNPNHAVLEASARAKGEGASPRVEMPRLNTLSWTSKHIHPHGNHHAGLALGKGEFYLLS